MAQKGLTDREITDPLDLNDEKAAQKHRKGAKEMVAKVVAGTW